MKRVCVLCLFLSSPLLAQDLGVQGKTFEVKEDSLLEVIEGRLKEAQASGKIEKLTSEYAERVKQSALHPKAVEGLETAQMYRSWLFDPSLHVQEDILNHKGQVIAAAGTVINPLHTYSWGEPLIFIDGEDEAQVSWALAQEGKIVLVKGSSIELEDRVIRPIYFDQAGSLSKRFQLRAVPAMISQKGDRLKVEEIPLL